MSADVLTLEELAERGGTSVERLGQLVDLGIVRPTDGGFRRPDVMVVRVVEMLEDKGIDAASVAAALETGDLSLGYLESAGRRHPRSETTLLSAQTRMSCWFVSNDMVIMGTPPQCLLRGSGDIIAASQSPLSPHY